MYREFWRPNDEATSGRVVIYPSGPPEAKNGVGDALATLLGEMFSLYVSTRALHWQKPERSLLLAEQAEQILATTDLIAERVQVLGGSPIRSIGEIGPLQWINDSAAPSALNCDSLTALLRGNRWVAKAMRRIHARCEAEGDFASAFLLEDWIDEAEGRYWFLFEMRRDA
jgi:starvation-inducible DNA-binding protein